MDGFSRLNASGRLSGEWDTKQICNRGCWRTGKYIFFLFTQPQMFIRRHCGERRGEEPAKTPRARQHASRISIHFNSFLCDPLLVRKSTKAVPWSKHTAIQPISKYSGSWGACYTVLFYAQGPSVGRLRSGYKASKVLQQTEPSAGRMAGGRHCGF